MQQSDDHYETFKTNTVELSYQDHHLEFLGP